jgi:phospholipid/cholesterol/gamma-HCH transport system substrate-binding protein
MTDSPHSSPEPDAATAAEQEVQRLARRATLLLLAFALLVVGSVAYVMYARGVFEDTQTLVLVSDDSEGVTVGMDMTFSGFPIGRVQRIELSPEGNARIIVEVAQKDAGWLRTSSVFTMERGLVGGPRIRAYSGVLTDPPLPDGAERQVLRGDASAEIPRLMAAVRDLLTNLGQLTAADAPLNTSLANVQAVTERLKGPQGALAALMGNEADARKLVEALNRTNALLARVDGMAAKADAQVFGAQGLLPEAQATVVELRGLLSDARSSLQKVDAVLVEAQGIAANTRSATTDLGALRADVEASLRRVDQLINEVNRKWPFARDPQVKLP